jgi:hypothetical protein
MGKQFVYEIKKYSAEQFVRLAYFCTTEGDCRLDELPTEQMSAFADLLNERGAEGWELVQVFFNTDGVVTLWKKEQ